MQRRDDISGDDPYTTALEVIKNHQGTSSQEAMAKCILSLYSSCHPYSISEILTPLDATNKTIVFAMIYEFSRYGETQGLREAGRWVFHAFPYLVDMSNAMCVAKAELKREWMLQRAETLRKLYPEE